jgi:phenylacetate-CoA ligase
LPEGVIGELVFTTLTKQALPLLRFRTGDLASISRAPCRCGRTHARMSRIVGRSDDMLIIRGVNVFPSQVESALVGVEHLSAHHQIVVSRPKNLDRLEIRTEVSSDFCGQIGAAAFADSTGKRCEALTHLEKIVHHRLKEALGLSTEVSLLPPGALPRSDGGKLQRVIDLREDP